MNAALKNVPLKRLGHVVAYHEARAKEGIEKKRHSAIAKEYRGIITTLFLERLSAGDYDVESQSA